MAGVAVCIIGVIACGKAAMLKSASQQNGADQSAVPPAGDKMIKGLITAFLSGVLCACYSIAFSYGGDVMSISMKSFGNEGWRAAFAVSALILWGGSVSALGYCIFKFFQNKSWGTLSSEGIGRTLLIALIMALLHNGAIIFFGIGASKLGALGVAVGYAIFMSFAIIVGNINGFLTKEWKGASGQSIRWIATGILILVIGVSVLATGNYMQGEYQKKTAEPVNAEK
jgi:L-rhamnose-H+ transport protein